MLTMFVLIWIMINSSNEFMFLNESNLVFAFLLQCILNLPIAVHFEFVVLFDMAARAAEGRLMI
jgi:hypothetical protein